MTLTLTAEQPEPMIEMPQQSAATEILATVVTMDGVVVRVAERTDGSLALLQGANRAPVIFDRYQRRALLDAILEARQ